VYWYSELFLKDFRHDAHTGDLLQSFERAQNTILDCVQVNQTFSALLKVALVPHWNDKLHRGTRWPKRAIPRAKENVKKKR